MYTFELIFEKLSPKLPVMRFSGVPPQIVRMLPAIVVLLLAWTLPCSGAPLRKIFFFDEEDVLYRAGTKKVLHELTKTPHPGLLPYIGSGGEPSRKTFEGQIAFVSVYRKPDLPNGQPPPSPRYQLWFQAYTGSKTSDKRKNSNVGYAISEDGKTWKRPGVSPGVPGVGIYDFIDNVNADGIVPPPNPNDITVSGPGYTYTPASKTNIVLIGSGGYGDRFDNIVVVNPNEPDPNRLYKMIYTDWANTTSGPSINEPATYPNNVTPNPNPDPTHIGSGTQVAFSPDGVHWTKFSHPNYPGYPGPAVVSKIAYGASGQPPTTTAHASNPEDYQNVGSRHYWHRPLTMSDGQDVFFDPRRNKYVITGKMWVQNFKGDMSWKHAMGWTESSNFVDWSEPELLLTTSDKDADNIKFHTSPAFYYEGMYLCLNQLYTNLGYTGRREKIENKENIEIELMSSRDGKRWDRNFIGQPVLRRGAVSATIPEGDPGYYMEFDSQHIFTNSTPVILPDEMRFYYGAYGNKSGVGLATAKRDRLVGIQSAEPLSGGTAGHVTLRKVGLTGYRSIAVNAVAQAGGEIRVELLNREGRPIPNFTKADAIPLTGDATAPFATSVGGDPLNRKVRWGSDLSALPASDKTECFIRIHLKNAELFSCTLVP